jgi:hypothetical protein
MLRSESHIPCDLSVPRVVKRSLRISYDRLHWRVQSLKRRDPLGKLSKKNPFSPSGVFRFFWAGKILTSPASLVGAIALSIAVSRTRASSILIDRHWRQGSELGNKDRYMLDAIFSLDERRRSF